MSIAKNIKYLREAFGETKKELADAIYRSPSLITDIENGNKNVSEENRELIAEHYGVTVDSLANGDFSTLNFDNADFSLKAMKDLTMKLYPVIPPSNSSNDTYFKKAYEAHIGLIKNSGKTNIEDEFFDTIDVIIENYSNSYDNYNTEETIANTLQLFIIFADSLDDHTTKLSQAILRGESNKPTFVKDYLTHNIKFNKSDTIDNEAKSEFSEMILELIKMLKATKNYSDLGDFYLANTFLINIVDNDCTLDINRTIGFELMYQLERIDNKYAKNYIREMKKRYFSKRY